MSKQLKVKMSICLDAPIAAWIQQELKRRKAQGRTQSRSQIVNEAVFKLAEKGQSR